MSKFRKNITDTYKAQINLQMLATGTKRRLFCVADPNLENNSQFTCLWIKYDNNYTNAVVKRTKKFWKENIFPGFRGAV